MDADFALEGGDRGDDWGRVEGGRGGRGGLEEGEGGGREIIHGGECGLVARLVHHIRGHTEIQKRHVDLPLSFSLSLSLSITHKEILFL